MIGMSSMGLQRRPAIVFASTLVCLAGLCAEQVAQAQHQPIEVDGSRHVDPDIIRSYLHPNADVSGGSPGIGFGSDILLAPGLLLKPSGEFEDYGAATNLDRRDFR